MTQVNDGGPAFPVMPPADLDGRGSMSGYPFPDPGMSLRDWFAGRVLSGILAHPDTWGLRSAEIAATVYSVADAMLAARAKAGQAVTP